MKNRKIEWVGKIPEHWNIKRIAAFYCLRNEKVSDRDYPPLSVTKKGIVPQLDTAAKSDDGDNRKLVHKGDFAINSRSDRRGSCGISDYDGSVSLINIVLKPRGEASNKYYNWLFHTEQFADEFYKWGNGIVDDLWTTKWQNMKKIIIPVPPLSEQKAIAGFLDKKCGEVDALIADIQQEIETLEQYKRSVITEAVTKGLDPSVPMKDSGIDYLGRINSEWRLTKLGYICQKLNRPVPEKAEALICSNKGKVVLREDVSVGLISENDRMYQGVKVGDLCIHGMDTWHGAIAVSSLNGKITTVVHCCDSREDKRFIAYYLQMLAFKKVYKAISNGVRGNTSDFRSWDKAGDIYIVLPNRETQQQIADYLDKKCKEIEGVIADKQSQIETLESYKKSLIYEYVTGKKEVG